jgi:hypothetical protein
LLPDGRPATPLTPAAEIARIDDIANAEIAPTVTGLVVRRAPVDPTLPATGYEIAFSNRTGSDYTLRLTPAEFNSLSAAQIVQRWKENSLTVLHPLLEAFNDAGIPEGSIAPWEHVPTLGAGDIVSYTSQQRVDGATHTAQTPLHILLQHTPREIAATYKIWLDDPAKRAATRDPFSLAGQIRPGVRRGLPRPAP